MEYIKFILYGLIQGLTEFIPVSSTAHLKVISLFFGIDDPGPSLSAIIQIGSVFALIWYFKNEIFNFRSQYLKKKFVYLLNESLFRSILIGTIPIILFGGTIKLFFPYFLEKTLRSNLSIALVSFLMAIFMYIADSSKKGSINLKNHNYLDSFLIGFSQAFAIFPGVSRSGITISAGRFLGFNRFDSSKISFLLSIPTLAAVSIFGISNIIDEENLNLSKLNIYSMVMSFIFSYFTIKLFLNYIKKSTLNIFVFYRVILGLTLIIFSYL